VCLSLCCCCREPEVYEFDGIALSDHYVVWLDISMVNPALMEITDSLNDLDSDNILLFYGQIIKMSLQIILKGLALRYILKDKMELH
jgi:hypothetical protein